MGCELGSAGVHPTRWGFIYVSYKSLLKTYANDIDRHLKFYVDHNVLLLLIQPNSCLLSTVLQPPHSGYLKFTDVVGMKRRFHMN